MVAQSRRGSSVGGARRDDPLLGLTRDLSNQFEVPVVVQHGQPPRFGRCGNKGVDHGERSMLAAGGKRGLDLPCSLVISVRGGDGGKGPQSIRHLSVVVRVSGGVAQFECNRIAQRYLSSRSKRCKGRSHCGLCQPGKDAGVDEISDARHLFVRTPRTLGFFEVEPAFLSEQGDQLQPMPGVDDFPQGSIDRRSQGRRAENLTRFSQDIWINFHGCLGHP